MERIIGALEKGIITLLKLYQFLISPLLGNRCRFYPSCSQYSETAILRFGILKGLFLTVYRVARCHPWHVGGEDPVPHK